MSYICPSCRTEHDTFELASTCCKADYIECPLSELPDDAIFSPNKGKVTYSYGRAFTKRWELVLNSGKDVSKPVRVYPLPPLVNKLVMMLVKSQYESGVRDAKAEIRQALGIDS